MFCQYLNLFRSMFQQSEFRRKVTSGGNCFQWFYQSNTIASTNTTGKQERSEGTSNTKMTAPFWEPGAKQEIQHQCLFHNCKDPQKDALHKIYLVSLQEIISKALETLKTVTKIPNEFLQSWSKNQSIQSSASCLKCILVY